MNSSVQFNTAPIESITLELSVEEFNTLQAVMAVSSPSVVDKGRENISDANKIAGGTASVYRVFDAFDEVVRKAKS